MYVKSKVKWIMIYWDFAILVILCWFNWIFPKLTLGNLSSEYQKPKCQLTHYNYNSKH